MKKIIAVLLILILCVSFVGCGDGAQSSKQAVQLAKAFLYGDEMIVLLDYTPTDANVTLCTSGFNLSFDSNTYQPNILSKSKNTEYIIDNFTHYLYPDQFASSGYQIPGGSEPRRIAVVYKINTHDLEVNKKGSVHLFNCDVAIPVENIVSIDTIDGIFQVESNPQESQMVESYLRRIDIASKAIEILNDAFNKGYDTGDDFSFIQGELDAIFSESINGGISIGNNKSTDPKDFISTDLMTFNLDTVINYYPEIEEDLTTYVNGVKRLVDIIAIPGNKVEAKELCTSLSFLKNGSLYKNFKK